METFLGSFELLLLLIAYVAIGVTSVIINPANSKVIIIFFNVLFPRQNIFLHFVYQYDNILLLQMQQINFTTQSMKITEETHYINTIYYKIEQTAKYCKHLGTQIFEKLKLPISLDEFTTLDTISIYGEICQRDLAKLILKDRPSTGRILNSLEERGFITRFADTKNNRLVRKMKLTKKGKDTLDKALITLKEYLEKLPLVLSDSERTNLEKSIQMFKQGLEKEVEMNI